MVATVTIIFLSLAEPSLELFNHCEFCVSEDTVKDLPSPPLPFFLVNFSHTHEMCPKEESRRDPILSRRGIRGFVGPDLSRWPCGTFSWRQGPQLFSSHLMEHM